jgi:hypothetical protein
MPDGKPAFTRCIQLDESNHCLLFGKPERPSVCSNLRPQLEMCGESNETAFSILQELEIRTKPEAERGSGQTPLIGR